MNWAGFSIKNRYTIYALALAILVFGAQSYLSLPISLFPETSPPVVTIITQYPGATALDVAEKVSEDMEEEVAALDGIAKVSSKSQDGLSVVTAEFQYDVSVDLAAVDVQNAVSRIRGSLPESISDPRVLKISSSDKPVITLGVSSHDGNLKKVRQVADDEIAPALQRLRGVASVDIFGGYRRQINISIDRDRMEAANVTLSAISQAIQTANISRPLGSIDNSRREVLLRFDESLTTADEVKSIPIKNENNQRLLVGDIAEVEDGVADPQSAFLANGTEVVAVQVLQQDDANTVEVVDRVTAELPELRTEYPDLKFEVATEEGSFTEQVTGNMATSIALALFLASLIIFGFLESFRRAFIVSIAMPMSFLLTFALMKLNGMELDLVTLSAIILAVGMVVDGAVVVIENISRHYDDENISAKEAAIDGTGEVFFAVLVGVATTIIVLIPFQFLTGFVGKVFGPLSLTMIFAFGASILMAVTLIPLLFFLLERNNSGFVSWIKRYIAPFNRGMDKLRDGYLVLLDWSLSHRTILLTSTLIIFIGSMALLGMRGMEVLPKLDSGSFFISIEAEAGSSFEQTKSIVRDIEALLNKDKDVINYTSQIGFEPDAKFFGDAGAMGVQQAFITVDLVSRKERARSIWEIEDQLRDKINNIPGIRTAVLKEMGGTAKSTTSAPIDVRISGPDLKKLNKLAKEVSQRVRKVEGAVNIYRQWTLERPQVQFTVDRMNTAFYDLTPKYIAQETFAAVEGLPVTQLDAPDGTDPNIVVRYDSTQRKVLDDVLQTKLKPGLPLSSVAKTDVKLAPNLITRENLIRTADVLGFTYDRAFSHVIADIEKSIGEMDVPDGYEMKVTGENSDLQESRSKMLSALFAALIAVYLLMVAQFRSFIHPFTVMLAVPLVAVGAAIALIITGKVISMSVLIGFILLIGIAVNNSVILIDFILHQMEGESREEIVKKSVAVRFRPIMMTTFSTVIGMLPLAMELALGAERFSPMAIVIIGGLTASSILTMVVVPVFYTVVDDIVNWLKSRKAANTS
ncbi:efflux RND transporter permease subunit [Fodinibius sediminis]|uniref:Multidrug efflux pump subunit AcrB n=1 Tax=Fodinibius sediminis TaxID=1214077 RepID=A0A521EXS1_9BACT|nr:efflux RND transporter permease subunit [Fodinibius sediminis]SMO88687.1 Multidrug efflux pump subunit AcrB [Fodinibius sediminis]